jgi:hypothetical protein
VNYAVLRIRDDYPGSRILTFYLSRIKKTGTKKVSVLWGARYQKVGTLALPLGADRLPIPCCLRIRDQSQNLIILM